jgi:TPR repeat protein
LGTDKDAEKAYRWAMRAYESGHGAGKHALGHCYAEGLGIPRNKAAAESLFRESAAKFILSKYSLHGEKLGQLLSTPVGAKVPLETKVSLGADERKQLLADLQAAADGGVEAARCGLAYLSCYGIKGIIEAKPKEGLGLLEDEARKGSPVAHYYLACIWSDGIANVAKPDPQKLVAHARTAAEAGLASAQVLLTWAYLHAPGVARNYEEARQWAELADSQGSTAILPILCEIHFESRGVPKDVKKAAEYAERGDAAGNRRAILYRGILYWNGEYYPQDRDKAITFFERAGQLGEADGWFWAGRYYTWKYWGALAHDRPAGSYGEDAAYSYFKAHRLGNKEAWQEFLGFAEYGKEVGSRIRREEGESASPPPAR